MRARFWGGLFLVGLIGVVGGTARATPPPAELRAQARAAYHAGDYQQTVDAALAGLAALPDDGSEMTVRAGLWQWAGVGINALGDHKLARERLETSLALYRSAGDRREVAATLNSIAEVHALLGDRAAQLAVLVESHAIFEELGETVGRAALANSLGNYYAEMGDPAKALPWHEQSVALRRTLDRPQFLANGLENLGLTYQENGDAAAARLIYGETVKLYRELKDDEGLAGVLTNMGTLESEAGRPEEALAYFREALVYDEAADYKPGQAVLQRQIGATLVKLGRPEEALSWLDRATELAESLEEPDRIIAAREQRAEALEQVGRTADALADLRVVMARRTNQETAARAEALLDLQTKFETVQNEREIDRLERLAAERALGLTRSEAAREAAEQAHAVERAQRQATLAMACGAAAATVVLAILFFFKRRTARRLARQQAELAAALADLRQANDELKRLYARKSEWLGFAVHELRSPLFAIDGCCAEVVDGLVDSPVGNVVEIRSAAARMRRELDAWLESERAEQDSFTLQLHDSDLAEVADTVVATHQAAARAKRITLTVDHENAGDARAQLDDRRWSEVLDNLVSNAIKFSPAGRQVWVRTGRTDEVAWCRVEDEGPGLTPEDRSHLFGAFARLSAQPTAGESSTGLGLHWAKRLVEAHGGTILAEDRAGGGLLWVVTVPAVAEVVRA